MFSVYLEDVFNQPLSSEDREHRDMVAQFASYDEALAYSKKRIDDFINQYLEEHPFDQEALEFFYSMHGEEPHIEPMPQGELFSGRAYFLVRLQELSGKN